MKLTRVDFLKCCGSTKWADGMAAGGQADEVFRTLEASDWLEAFRAHPRIGERKASGWAAQEQSGASIATEDIFAELADWNQRYFEKFGYIFIVFATGKGAGEMLAILQSRMSNSPEDELHAAAREQTKITRLRLERLLA